MAARKPALARTVEPSEPPATPVANRLPVDEMSEMKDALIAIARAIARTIGPRCEVVLHDYQQWGRSGSTIVWIENGHVTGRRVGGPTTNLGLEAVRSGAASPDRYNYVSHTKDGRVLRSTSIYFQNRTGRLIGSLCINVDVDALVNARAALDALLGTQPEPIDDTGPTETFGNDIGEVLDAQIQAALNRTGKPAQALSRDERISVVGYLDEKGAFLVKRAADRIARALGTSRVTVYSYLEESRAGGASNNGRAG